MSNLPQSQAAKAQLFVWWIVWMAMLGGLVIIYVFLGRGPVKPAPASETFVNLAGMVPLFVSIVIRWLVLPRYTAEGRALVVFIAGLALAEACGILGIFLGAQYRDDLFLLGVLGVVQYFPLFAVRPNRPDKGQFIPNN